MSKIRDSDIRAAEHLPRSAPFGGFGASESSGGFTFASTVAERPNAVSFVPEDILSFRLGAAVGCRTGYVFMYVHKMKTNLNRMLGRFASGCEGASLHGAFCESFFYKASRFSTLGVLASQFRFDVCSDALREASRGIGP